MCSSEELLAPLFKYHRLNLKETEEDEKDPNQILNRETIKLLTYNFFLRPPPIKNNKDDYKEERLNSFKEFMDNFDIICFQEVFGSFKDRKHKMIKNAIDRGFQYYATGDPPPFFSKFLIDGGLLVLSRFPIVECQKITYDYGVMSDGMSMKGILFVKIKLKNNYLCLFTTHLQASYFDSGESLWKYTVKTRELQSEVLINFIYKKISELPKEERKYCKFLLCGDFNMDGGHGHEKYIKNKGFTAMEHSEIEIFVKKLSILGKIEDLTKKKFGEYPVTFGNNTGDYDKVLTGKADINSMQSLDYIFEICPDYRNQKLFPNQEEELQLLEQVEDQDLKVIYHTVKVEPFVVKNEPYQQLSDHFGVSVELKLNSS